MLLCNLLYHDIRSHSSSMMSLLCEQLLSVLTCTYVFLNSYYSDILTTCLTLKRLGNRTTMFQVWRSLSYCRASSTSRWVCRVSSVCCSVAIKTTGPSQITDLRNCALSFKMHSCVVKSNWVELHKLTSRMTQDRSDTVKRPRQNTTTSFSHWMFPVKCHPVTVEAPGPPGPPAPPPWPPDPRVMCWSGSFLLCKSSHYLCLLLPAAVFFGEAPVRSAGTRALFR